jgi:hypothetical protein
MTEAETADPNSTDAGTDADRGPRGVSFPTMDLAKVVEVIHKVGGHGADFVVSTFAQYCGHQTANSGPFRTKLAAFRDWSMVTTKDGRVLLTDLGKDVARSADPMADEVLLRRAFDACKIFKNFYDNQAKGIPIKRDVLGRGAVFDLKVAAKSQERFVTTLVDSAVTVGLASPDTEAGTVTFNAGAAGADVRQEPHATPPETGHTQSDTSGGTGTTTERPLNTSNAPVLLRQVWPTATGEIVLAIHSTAPLPASAFGLVGEVVQAADELARSIGLSAPTADNAA